MKRFLFILALLPSPIVAQSIFVYPAAPVAPRGSYQTATAIITGVNDKTVTWTADGGRIVGTNPCVGNEPCTVALYVTTSGTYHLTATSNVNHSVSAVSTITFTPSPTVTVGHPREIVTAAMLPGLQAKATSGNTLYQSTVYYADHYLTEYMTAWTSGGASFSNWDGSACTGGSSPVALQAGREGYAYLAAWLSMVAPTAELRNRYGCRAHDVWVYNMAKIMSGAIAIAANEVSDSVNAFTLTGDWLMGGGYMSSSDIALQRQWNAYALRQSLRQADGGNMENNGCIPPNATWNGPSEFVGYSIGSMRCMGNNYTHARMQYLAALSTMFDDNPTDDPPLANTCSATRYQVCPDMTAGSMHAYLHYLMGAALYLDYAHLEDPNVSWQAYQAHFANLPTQPKCLNWAQGAYGAVPCFGDGRGGESAEGSWYGWSFVKLRYALNILHTTGNDDPMIWGPQASLGTSSWWDLHTVEDLEFLTGFALNNGGIGSGAPSYSFLSTGDSNTYWRAPMNFETEAATMTADSYTGRTDRISENEWIILNSAFGGPLGTSGGCKEYCGFTAELAGDLAQGIANDLFISLPAGDPTKHLPPDPRPSLPADLYNGSFNQHQMARSGWTGANANSVFSYYCGNTLNNHEDATCGRFDVFSGNEYITKGRIIFNDYNALMLSAPQSNEVSIMNPTGRGASNIWTHSATQGGEWFQGMQAGFPVLYHSELPAYVADIADETGNYNGWWVSGDRHDVPSYNDVTSASRSLIYLRGANQIVVYDRATTGHAAAKAFYLNTTGNPTITSNIASWPTRSALQKGCLTSLLPSRGTLSNAGLTAGGPDQSADWEPYTTLEVSAGDAVSTRFLNILEWSAIGFTCSRPTLIGSSAGQSFDGALVGSSLVMFMRNWPGSLTSTTFPASGATEVYVSDLTTNAHYAIVGAGAPPEATTDTAGVLSFAATGTGNITVRSGSRSGALPRTNLSTETRVANGVFWLSLGGIVYTYAGYPLIIWMLARIRPCPWNAAPITPSVSFVLAVHNGVSLLPRKIQHLLDLDYPGVRQIIIVSDGSTDGTEELLASQRHPRLRTIVLKEHRGKAVAVNAGVAEATADVIVFVDIRPEIAPGAIQQLVSNFADKEVGCVSGNLKLCDEGHDATSAAIGDFYWRYEQWLRMTEAAVDSPVGVYGGFYAIRRELYVQQPAGVILDDMFQPLSIIRLGYRSVVDPLALVYDTWPKKSGAEFHRKVRTLAGNFQLFQLMPWTLTPGNRLLFQLVSHKVMRVVVPYLLVLLLVSAIMLSAGSKVFATFAALQIAGWVVAVVGLRYTIPGLHRVAAPASAMLVLNAAAVVGLYRFLFTRGPLWKIWNQGKAPGTGMPSGGKSLASQ